MINSKLKLFVGFLLFMIVFLLAGCDNSEEVLVTQNKINTNTKKTVTHITSGRIGSGDLIAVRFAEPQVIDSSLFDVPLDNKIFSFEPDIEGSTYWVNDRTLAFEPERPLLEQNKYIGTINFKALFYGIEDVNPVEKSFEFETSGRIVSHFSGSFELAGKDENQLVFAAELEFNESATEEEVKSAVLLFREDEQVNFNLQQLEDRSFIIKSEAFERTEEFQNICFIIDDEILKLNEKLEKNYTLSPVGMLTVERIEEVKPGSSSLLRVVFSDLLDPDKNYLPYININPNLDINIKIDGNTMLIDGDFQAGQKYKLTVLSGLKSKLGKEVVTNKDYELEIEISDTLPKLEFSKSGIFLTSSRDKKINFRTMNVERVQVRVKKVEEENLVEFFEENSYRAHSSNFYKYDRYSFKRIGETLASKILEIGTEKNKWVQSQLDLADIITDENGLYIVQLEYGGEDVLAFPANWSDARVDNYIYQNARKAKHLILTDLGVTAKEAGDDLQVFVTDVIDAEPVKNARVILRDENNMVMSTGNTDERGMYSFELKGDEKYLEVKRRYQYTIMALDDTRLNYSIFDTGGEISKEGIKAFMYTERGVYRPGDEINLSVILRNEEKTFPENHPVTLKFYNPRNKLLLEQVEKEAVDGFYSFNITTDKKALTGSWRAEINAAGVDFTKTIRIEEIVPYKIEVDIKPEKEQLTLEDENVNFKLISRYLFGSPADGLDTETKITVEPIAVTFDKYSDFIFDNQSIDSGKIESSIIAKKLNDNGKTDISWEMPEINNVPSALMVNINSRVIQKGGRQVPEDMVIPVEVYDRYVGINKLGDYSSEIGSKARFDIILVDNNGELVAGEKLNYRLYKSRQYWWWHYGDSDNFRKHYKSDEFTQLIDQGELISEDGTVSIEHHLSDYGEMLLEVEDPEGGHCAGYFFRSYWWGDSDNEKSPDTINIKTDKELYHPGDKAKIQLNTPIEGKLLLTVEKSNEIIEHRWLDIEDTSTELTLEIGEEYTPNVYIYVSVFQPYDKINNDLPLRMYGIVPLEVQPEDSKLDISMDTPESIEPGQNFEIKINSIPETQFTLAVVDEGLLDITDFETPDPWKHFFSQEKSVIRTFDSYGDIIGLSQGYIHNFFSVGGGMRESARSMDDYMKDQQQSEEADRFEAVNLFKGPIKTDENGEAVVSFEMPNYIGRVRVMAVSAGQGAYGNAEEKITVKYPLMVMPALPRVLGPEDKIEFPVTVFGMEENIGEVEVKMDLEGPIYSVGSDTKTLDFTTAENKTVNFELAAENATGVSSIKITADTHEFHVEDITDMAVRAYMPYTYISRDKIVQPGKAVSFKIPEKGLKNTTESRITISGSKNIKINHRLKWLIRYPYGCVEQITSRVFPQLYLTEIQDFSLEEREEIDKNINAAVKKLREFQLSDGAFSYWPNGSSANYWGTNYVGHFMLEAKRKGYYVPDDMFNAWINYQKERSRVNSSQMTTRAYRLYLLSLAGEENLSAMNYMRESKMEEMKNIAEYYLAAAYKLAGYNDIAFEMLDNLDTKVEDYQEFAGTYGSSLRDQAVILEILSLFEKDDKTLPLFRQIADRVSSEEWMSTQTTAYALMSCSKFLMDFDEEAVLDAEVIFPDGSKEILNSEELMVSIMIKEKYAGKNIKVNNLSGIPLFAEMAWEGIPVEDNTETEDKNLFLTVQWRDEDGNEIDPGVLEQGTTFWGYFIVDKEISRAIEEIALVQILPSGWEIENIRLLESSLPDWMDNYNLDHEKYLDIRDDRIMWFFDMDSYGFEYEFVVKLNAVTTGDFYLPPTMVEAMYNNDYKATKAGKSVKVILKEGLN